MQKYGFFGLYDGFSVFFCSIIDDSTKKSDKWRKWRPNLSHRGIENEKDGKTQTDQPNDRLGLKVAGKHQTIFYRGHTDHLLHTALQSAYIANA